MWPNIVFLLALTACGSTLYSPKDEVVLLTEQNFKTKVLESNAVWIVEFFAPWCGHCKNLVPEYKKAANALKGMVKMGAVDMTQHESLGQPYGIKGYPTIKIFGADKKKPTDYSGPRTAQGLVDAALSETKKIARQRLGGGSSSSGANSNKHHGSSKDVVELTDANFEKKVLKSKSAWLVAFYAPWCGHCKNLMPNWEAAASEVKGQVNFGLLDATVHKSVAERFSVHGYPTIKYFAPGSGWSDAEDYQGGRNTGDLVAFATGKYAENAPAPEVVEGTSPKVIEDACKDRQMCIFSFLPHILDCQSKCRNAFIKTLQKTAEKFKKNKWGFVWTEAGSQPQLEQAFGVGGFGYPAMAAFNSRKNKVALLKGSFGTDGIHEFLRDLSYGKGHTSTIAGEGLPEIITIQKWDGKDAVAPKVEEIDLSDVDLGRLDDDELEHNEL